VLCRFYRDLYPWDELVKILPLVTGMAANKESLSATAAHIATMTRHYNLQEGLSPQDDRLPARLHKQALPDGKTLTAEEMEYMLNDYYRLRGWDAQGVPPQN
jgi:aldehyde:ferredoxin oxidoreductase